MISTLVRWRPVLLTTWLACAAALPVAAQQDFTGSWTGAIALPFDPKPSAVRIGLEANENGEWTGAFDTDAFGPGLMRGRLEAGTLKLDCDDGSSVNPLTLSFAGDATNELDGKIIYQGIPLPIRFERSATTWADDLRIERVPPTERPEQVTLAGLPDFWLPGIEARVDMAMERQSMVGLAMAIVVDGKLFDVRSWGWSDLAAKTPVNGETLFRWASISKSVTGVVATKMALAGIVDLDADVREIVPEFPEKKSVVTARLLLSHLAGIPHYQHLPLVTRIDYDDEFPFRDPVRAIDMFRAAPLIHEPGSEHSYSTHGFVLAGAVLERASKLGFKAEVRRLVSEPLGMTSFEPDDPTARRAKRTHGYRWTSDGRLFDSLDDDISWKLAGGGFQSTVSDLARFAVGLCDETYLDAKQRELLWTPAKTNDGRATGYALGFSVQRDGERLEVSHSGAQRRTATYLLVYPEERIAVALMCNTEGVRLQALAHKIAEVLHNEE